jgi:hypothetical protein
MRTVLTLAMSNDILLPDLLDPVAHNELAFDADRLLSEFQQMASMIQHSAWYRISINYSYYDDDNAPIDTVFSPSCEKLTTEFDNLESHKTLQLMQSWNSDNILKPFQGSYTASVVQRLDSYFRQYGERVTIAKFTILHSRECYVVHSDFMQYRYHVPVKTNEHVYFMADRVLIQMQQAGKLYRIRTDNQHTVMNAGNESRIHLIIDTCKL